MEPTYSNKSLLVYSSAQISGFIRTVSRLLSELLVNRIAKSIRIEIPQPFASACNQEQCICLHYM